MSRRPLTLIPSGLLVEQVRPRPTASPSSPWPASLRPNARLAASRPAECTAGTNAGFSICRGRVAPSSSFRAPALARAGRARLRRPPEPRAGLKEVEQGKAWPAAAQAPTLDNKSCTFSPAIQAIPAGKFDIKNSDPVLHNTHGFYGRRSTFNVALPNQGQTIEVDLPRAGQVRIECDAHGWMLGWVYAVANPYYALTGEDGTFEITEVPPGDYTLIANQAHTGPIEVDVTVTAGETAEVPVELAAP